jgi:hypothetical protein
VERVTIIESSSNTKQGDPLKGPLFALAHYWAFLKTIAQATKCVFPSLRDDTHILGPLNDITPTFDHLSTELTLVGLKVKVWKCKLWNPSKISWNIKIPQGCALVTNGLRIFGVPLGFHDFATHFLDEVLSQDVLHINDPLVV